MKLKSKTHPIFKLPKFSNINFIEYQIYNKIGIDITAYEIKY